MEYWWLRQSYLIILWHKTKSWRSSLNSGDGSLLQSPSAGNLLILVLASLSPASRAARSASTQSTVSETFRAGLSQNYLSTTVLPGALILLSFVWTRLSNDYRLVLCVTVSVWRLRHSADSCTSGRRVWTPQAAGSSCTTPRTYRLCKYALYDPASSA